MGAAGGPELVHQTVGMRKGIGGVTAFAVVDIAVPAGDHRPNKGPNGARKTTYFNLDTGDLPRDVGHVYLARQ